MPHWLIIFLAVTVGGALFVSLPLGIFIGKCIALGNEPEGS